jgi:hypothetical protein
VERDTISYMCTMISACAKGPAWQLASSQGQLVGMLSTMARQAKVEWHYTISYMCTLISACEKGWRMAMGLHSTLTLTKVERDTISFMCTMISACAKGPAWQLASSQGQLVGMLSTMARRAMVELHYTISYMCALISACEKGRRMAMGWHSTVALTLVERDTISYTVPTVLQEWQLAMACWTASATMPRSVLAKWAEQWLSAVGLHNTMAVAKVKGEGAISYTPPSVLASWARQWLSAVVLHNTMAVAKVKGTWAMQSVPARGSWERRFPVGLLSTMALA